MIEYRLALAERSTTGLGAEIISDVYALTGDINDSGLTFTETLNDVGSLEFSLPLDHPSVTTDNFAVGQREVYLYRNSTLVWGGKLWTVDVQDWEGRFVCYDFAHDLDRRIIHDDYAQTSRDVYNIVWDLVTDTQDRGGLGITRDFSTRGRTRKFVVCMEERKTVLDAIKDLSAEHGSFDFRVSPDKKLQTYDPTRGSLTTVAFNDSNITTFRHTRDATNLETVVGAIGPEEDCDIPSLYETTSANTSLYGVLDGTIDEDGIIDDDRREGTADEQLRMNEVPKFTPDVSFQTPLQEWNVDASTGYDVGFDDVNVGDVVAISTSSVQGPSGGFRDFNGSFRVMEKTVDVKTMGFETVTFTLDQVVT